MNEKVQLAVPLHGVIATVINMLPLESLENEEHDCYTENTSYTWGPTGLLF